MTETVASVMTPEEAFTKLLAHYDELDAARKSIADLEKLVEEIREAHGKDAKELYYLKSTELNEVANMRRQIDHMRAEHGKDARELFRLKEERQAQADSIRKRIVSSAGTDMEVCTQCGHPCSGCDFTNYRGAFQGAAS